MGSWEKAQVHSAFTFWQNWYLLGFMFASYRGVSSEFDRQRNSYRRMWAFTRPDSLHDWTECDKSVGAARFSCSSQWVKSRLCKTVLKIVPRDYPTGNWDRVNLTPAVWTPLFLARALVFTLQDKWAHWSRIPTRCSYRGSPVQK